MANFRKVLGPDVIRIRYQIGHSNNIWYFINIINKQIRVNPIKLTGAVDATLNLVLDSDLADRIVDLYKESGWSSVTYAYVKVRGDEYGNVTIFTLTP